VSVYKYLHPDRVDVLRGGRIRYTQATALNDPFEIRPYFKAIIAEPWLVKQLAQPIDITEQLVQAYNNAPEWHGVISLEQWLEFVRVTLASPEGRETIQETLGIVLGVIRDATPEAREKFAETFTTGLGILSLSAVADEPLMWSHYADSHRGFVIKFDDDHGYFDRRRSEDDDFFRLRPVVYRPHPQHEALVDMTGEDVMLSKGVRWSYEQELRLVVPVRDEQPVGQDAAGEPVYLFDFPADAVTGVILGARSAPALTANVQAVLADPRYSHISLRRATLAEESGAVIISDAAI
jgi:hypothetical protein